MATKTLPSQEYLRQCLDYDPETGELTWRERPREHFSADGQWKRWNKCYAGTRAGSFSVSRGSIALTINGSWYAAQNLIWRLITGNQPSHIIDHRDCNPSDNRWTNLREATTSQNCQNRRAEQNARTGLKGIYLTSKGTFRARIYVDGRRIHLGEFPTKEQAHGAYAAAALRYFGDFAHS